jgi:hypothetical protein
VVVVTTVRSEESRVRFGADIFVRREGPAVVIGSDSGDLDRHAIERLRAVLVDLIDGQGNLTIEVALPGVAVVDLRLLDVLVDAERRLASRDGRLSVTTRDGHWEGGPQAVDR